jgi:hypothetical protein
MSKDKTAGAEFRQLVGVDFDEFTRRAPIKLLLELGRYADPVDTTVWQFTDESHSLFEQQRAKLVRAVRRAWQLGGAEQRRQMTELVRSFPRK